jgi:hypothetical protein
MPAFVLVGVLAVDCPWVAACPRAAGLAGVELRPVGGSVDSVLV